MISDVYIFHVHLEHSIFSLGQVIQYLCFLLITLLQVAGTELTSMLQLKNFKAETLVVLLQELGHFVLFEESRSTELNTPPRSVVLLDR